MSTGTTASSKNLKISSRLESAPAAAGRSAAIHPDRHRQVG
jgi:hypothetical protein